jgi:hypothetical protein
MESWVINRESEKLGFEAMEKFPVRMVMNTKTLTIFRDDTYSTVLLTFLLETTKFIRVTDRMKTCFILASNSNKAEICEIEGSKVPFADEWDYDFNLFKNQCKESRPEIQLSKSEEKKLEGDYKEKLVIIS